MHCLLCHQEGYFLNSDYWRCKNCLTVFFLKAESVSYEEEYFMEEYQNQYGKTYLEDELSIRNRARTRLHFLRRFVLPDQTRLLEIGSAAGFFLQEATSLGFTCEGWEISKSMSKFANARGVFTRQGDFFSLVRDWAQKQEARFHVVAAFYVMEHFKEQAKFWQSVHSLLEPSGFLLLALPSVYGPQFFFHRKVWYRTHPQDHFVDYSPYALKKVGHVFGFRRIFVHPEGIHPERFPLSNCEPLKAIYKECQKLLSFSDTIFAILQKTK